MRTPKRRARAADLPVGDQLMRMGEAALVFRVDPRTVRRWCDGGLLTTVYTPGGHRRVIAAEVYELRKNAKS